MGTRMWATQQLTWTVLPQGFRDSPISLAKPSLRIYKTYNLRGELSSNMWTICSPTQELAIQHTVQTLNFLAKKGHKVSKSKAQLIQQQVSYLGVIITSGRHSPSPEQNQAIINLSIPTTGKQLRAFLGLTGYCRVWIPNYGLFVQPLYGALKGKSDSTPLNWGPFTTVGYGQF